MKFRWCSLGKIVFISAQTLDIDFQIATTRFYLFYQRQYTVWRLSNGSVSATETQHSDILFTYRGSFEGIAIKHMLNVLFQNMTCFISTSNSIIYLIPLMVEAASRYLLTFFPKFTLAAYLLSDDASTVKFCVRNQVPVVHGRCRVVLLFLT